MFLPALLTKYWTKKHWAEKLILVSLLVYGFTNILPLMGLELSYSIVTAVNIGIVTLLSVIFFVLITDKMVILFSDARRSGDWLKKLRIFVAMMVGVILVVVAIRYANMLQHMHALILGATLLLSYMVSRRTKS